MSRDSDDNSISSGVRDRDMAITFALNLRRRWRVTAKPIPLVVLRIKLNDKEGSRTWMRLWLQRRAWSKVNSEKGNRPKWAVTKSSHFLSLWTTMVSRLVLSRLAPLLATPRTASSVVSRRALCKARSYATSQNDNTVCRGKPLCLPPNWTS